MASKTPNFDKVLDEILKNLIPHERTCKQCKQPFKVEKEDIDFYKMLRVPPPALCPLCRKKRRFGHLMRVPKFFKKKCSVPGHNEEVISVFPPTSPHKIYDFSYWHSDSWDPEKFGRPYDLEQAFFPQFQRLFFDIPHVPLERDPYAQNCDYTLGGTGSKNNYYCSMGWHSEDCSYCFDARYCQSAVDCTLVSNMELCYGSVSSAFCSRCVMVIGCSGCMDSAFLYECKNCSHCFLSSNLRNKSYVFMNEQLTKEEYKKRLGAINLGDREVFLGYVREFVELYGNSLHRSVETVHCTNSIGDSLSECNNCYFVFRAQKEQNVRYVDNDLGSKDSMDGVNIAESERTYEDVVTIGSSNDFFLLCVRNSSFMEYCAECYNSEHCFGCIGLKNKKFHVFNKPYSESEYWPLVDGIKAKMLRDGEYGEFFPLRLGLVPYQSSNAQKYFPLTEEEAKRQTIPWYEELDSQIPSGVPLRYAPADIPADIRNVTDDILNDVIVCKTSKRPFRLVRSELDFYRKMNLPIPTEHPWQRMQDRVKWEHGIWLYPFICPHCKESSYSGFKPEEQNKLKIYCEKCYLKEVV